MIGRTLKFLTLKFFTEFFDHEFFKPKPNPKSYLSPNPDSNFNKTLPATQHEPKPFSLKDNPQPLGSKI